MTRPCERDHLPSPATCRLCHLYEHDPAYRALWDGWGNAVPPQGRRSLPCIHLGEVIDRLDCPCPGRWLRRCGLHAVCTVEVCKTCADYRDE
jgi:hypothetical protein